MRYPSGVDASVRWLVLTLTGAGMLVLLPSPLLDGVSWLPAGPVLGLTAVQLAALGIIAAAWAMDIYHLVRLPGRRLTDPGTVVLGSAGFVALVALVVAVVLGSGPAVIAALSVMVVAQLLLGVRIDWVRHHRGVEECPLTQGNRTPRQA